MGVRRARALLDAPFTEFLDATELFVDDLAATALPRDPPLLTCFDLEEAFAAATFGLLGVGDLAVFGLAANRWRGRLHLGRALHCRNLGLVHSGQRFAALGRLVRIGSAPPPAVVTRAFAASRINSGLIRRSK